MNVAAANLDSSVRRCQCLLSRQRRGMHVAIVMLALRRIIANGVAIGVVG